MQQNKVLVGVGIAVLAIAAGWIGGSFNGSTDTVTREVVRELQPVIEQAFAAVPVLSSPLEVNGVATHYLAQKFRTATSTLSSIQTPAATTTGEVVCRLFTAASYATGFQLATASTYDATTTNLGFVSVGASAGNAWVSATSTMFAPNQYINLKLSTSSGTTVGSGFAPTGSCYARLQAM